MVRAGIMTLLVLTTALHADEMDLAGQLRQLDDKRITVGALARRPLNTMLSDDARARMRAVNDRETEAWRSIATREEWEAFTAKRIKALRESLGMPEGQKPDRLYHVGRAIEGDGYRLECLVYQSPSGQWVPALLYLPAKKVESMPGFLICHSHHNPKTEGELQDMGVTWARLGCAVLVMDQLGHGERREHPFVNAQSFEGMFRAGRQDYYFRYNLSLQLYAAGSSLVGWMAADMSRGVDLLLERGADRKKIILLGAVAGGGDPAAVTAALDSRISCVVPFNFGGPQPETRFPLPDDAEKAFNYAGGGSWESTRNLRLSARDGFLPWVIVGSVAPRRVVHAHEFAWDKERDPVWKRYQKIFEFYKVADHLSSAKGAGSVRGQGAENTHCNNIGAVHRKEFYPALKQWFDIAIPEKDSRDRRAAVELRCLTEELKKQLKPEPAHVLAGRRAASRAEATAELILQGLPDEASQRDLLRKVWAKLLGNVEPQPDKVEVIGQIEKVGDVRLEAMVLTAEAGIWLPTLLFTPPVKEATKLPVVVGFCQDGKAALLRKHSALVAELLKNRVAVCLIDLRGTGETRLDSGRSRGSSATSMSATELMLGQTLVGSRLRDLRTVLGYLRQRPEIDGKRILLWGDSFAPINTQDAKLEVPQDVTQPPHAEPLGGLLTLFGTLFDENVKAAYGRGGLVNYRSLLDSPFLHVPHDAVVPGGIRVGDLDLIAKVLGKRVRLDGLVDGLNRAVSRDAAEAPVRWMLRALKD